jgi:hypothetical protein
MSLLDPSCCPNCKSIIDMSELYRIAPKSGATMLGNVAIECPVCRAELRVLQTRSYLVGLLAFLLSLVLATVSLIAAPVARGSTEYGIRMVMFVCLVWAGRVLHKRAIPKLLTVRLVQDEEIVRFPLAPKPSKPEEDIDPRSALELNAVEDDRPEWICTHCGEGNPGNFNECWKCQTGNRPNRTIRGANDQKLR